MFIGGAFGTPPAGYNPAPRWGSIDLGQRAVEGHGHEAGFALGCEGDAVTTEIVADGAVSHVVVAVVRKQAEDEVLEQVPFVHLLHLGETVG